MTEINTYEVEYSFDKMSGYSIPVCGKCKRELPIEVLDKDYPVDSVEIFHKNAQSGKGIIIRATIKCPKCHSNVILYRNP